MRELMKLGVEIGADVPYCLMRGTALAEGIGEKLTRLPDMVLKMSMTECSFFMGWSTESRCLARLIKAPG